MNNIGPQRGPLLTVGVRLAGATLRACAYAPVAGRGGGGQGQGPVSSSGSPERAAGLTRWLKDTKNAFRDTVTEGIPPAGAMSPTPHHGMQGSVAGQGIEFNEARWRSPVLSGMIAPGPG